MRRGYQFFRPYSRCARRVNPLTEVVSLIFLSFSSYGILAVSPILRLEGKCFPSLENPRIAHNIRELEMERVKIFLFYRQKY
jgi:hypothetical protein